MEGELASPGFSSASLFDAAMVILGAACSWGCPGTPSDVAVAKGSFWVQLVVGFSLTSPNALFCCSMRIF